MRGGVNTHRYLCRIIAGDLLVHLEEVPVPFANHVLTKSSDGFRQVQVNAQSSRSNAVAVVADALARARGEVTRREIAERGIETFEVVVPILFGDAAGCTGIALLFRNPDASI